MKSDDELHAKWTFNGCIREEQDTKRVYIFNKFTGKDMLLYDFGLETGDSIPIDNGQLFAKVTKVNYAPFGNSTVIRKQICFF